MPISGSERRQVYVAAGSNVEPLSALATALQSLRAHFPTMIVSRAYQNAAVGFEGPDFVNLAVGFETDLGLEDVLGVLHGIEAACGRGRTAPKWAPRRMDLDLLLFGDVVGEFPGATLPRPDLLRRAFMLGPLTEIAPDLVHPTAGRTLSTLWAEANQGAHALQAVRVAGATEP